MTIGLEGQATVAAARGEVVRAARLWGAAEAIREGTDERRWPVFQPTYERALAAARTQIAEQAWAAA